MTNELRQKIRQFEAKQTIAASLALIVVIGLSVVINSYQLNSIAGEATKFITRLVQAEDFREVGLSLEDTRLNGFTRIDFTSSDRSRNFTLPASVSGRSNSFWRDLVKNKITLSADTELGADYHDTITFEYNRLRLAPYAVIIWMLLVLVSIPQTRYMKQKLIEQLEKEMKGAEAQAKADIAREVRHNLRTPLAALMRIPARLPDSVKADRELILSSISQINSIVSALDETKVPNDIAKNESSEIYDTLIQALREISVTIPKRIRFTYDIDDSIVSALIHHVPHELRALLANIVSNSVDAISGRGQITIAARDIGPEVQISIDDSGSGISPEILPRIFEYGFSSGKPTGSGIGLHHAKARIERWGGQISATSTPGQSTTVLIRLPIEDRASWYIPRLKFAKDDRLIILDDQQSAHSLWKMRLEEVGALEQAQFASSDAEVEKLLRMPAPTAGRIHYLFDYDIKSSVSGLDILDRLPDSGRRYLVTGHFDDSEIRTRCRKSGVYLLPKGELARIQIVVL